MSIGSTADALRRIRTLFDSGTVAGMTDVELLDRFLGRRDEAAEVAFAALVARHGPMVLGVCRRALADPDDADDAFQATFLVLARKARSVRVGNSLGRWLYGVSRKVSARARADVARRRRFEVSGVDAPDHPGPGPDRREIASAVDEELARLPEPYRSAVLLCDLGGLTHEEAARDLGCPVGTVKSRLSRGRDRLRDRLARRGLAPSAGLLGMVPARLAESTIRAATTSATAGVVPASVLHLAEGILQAMSWTKLKFTAVAAVLSLGVAASGVGVMARQDKKGETPPGVGAPRTAVAADAPPAVKSMPIEAKLNEPVTLKVDATLGEAVQQLQNLTGLNIILDPKAMAYLGITPTTRVTLAADGIKLKDALRFLLRPLQLTYRPEDDVIVITTPPRDDPATRAQQMATLLGELDRARDRHLAARRITRNPEDPAIVKARKRVDRLQSAVDRIDEVLAEVFVDGPILVAPDPALPEQRLKAVERKLDEVLEALKRPRTP